MRDGQKHGCRDVSETNRLWVQGHLRNSSRVPLFKDLRTFDCCQPDTGNMNFQSNGTIL